MEVTDAADKSLRRACRRSTWMMDYKVTGIDVIEDVSHFTLFVDSDPTSFENVRRNGEK